MARHINGGVPLRGLATEQAHSSDAEVRDQARQALAITGGNAGKMLIDENGECIADDGRPVQVDDWADDSKEEPAVRATNELRREVTAQLTKMTRVIEGLAARLPASGAASPHMTSTAKTAPPPILPPSSPGAVAGARLPRRRQRVGSTGSEARPPDAMGARASAGTSASAGTRSVMSLSELTLSC